MHQTENTSFWLTQKLLAAETSVRRLWFSKGGKYLKSTRNYNGWQNADIISGRWHLFSHFLFYMVVSCTPDIILCSRQRHLAFFLQRISEICMLYTERALSGFQQHPKKMNCRLSPWWGVSDWRFLLLCKIKFYLRIVVKRKFVKASLKSRSSDRESSFFTQTMQHTMKLLKLALHKIICLVYEGLYYYIYFNALPHQYGANKKERLFLIPWY